MMVGLVTAQMTPLERSGVADSIGFADNFHDTIAYMLTLGVVREYRRAVSNHNKTSSACLSLYLGAHIAAALQTARCCAASKIQQQDRGRSRELN
jgi:hypothetical protein